MVNRERIRKITGSAGAKVNERLANFLAMETDISAEQAEIVISSVSPKEAGAPPDEATIKAISRSLSATGTPYLAGVLSSEPGMTPERAERIGREMSRLLAEENRGGADAFARFMEAAQPQFPSCLTDSDEGDGSLAAIGKLGA
ncbi:hypothetical protein [Klebsiella quasipneumoniae]|uniref:hypothetical protein n=1 Tax=Klebsiella quasipneumoniae TaxID=1463165 RepID=UPI00352A0FBF